MQFPFKGILDFTPDGSTWTNLGAVTSWSASPDGLNFTFLFGTRSLVLAVLGPKAYRIRFNSAPAASYDWEYSIAVVKRDLGLTGLTVTHTLTSTTTLVVDTAAIQLHINLAAFEVSVFRGGQLIHQDHPGQGIVYDKTSESTAVIKTAPDQARYVGCGEKAGEKLFKNDFAFAFFNLDNFEYNLGLCLGTSGPLNPSDPLYCSIPLLIETNPRPVSTSPFAGSGYACGVFLDNTGQSYANVTTFSNMAGKYFLGALHNELDYYFFAGDDIPEVLSQYTTLTGRSPMPPRYVFGFHQGAYGYYDRFKLSLAANAYRAARIPCDGLHIDVDFQDNYRTFTHSEMKFPKPAGYFATLHDIGFKVSTNITPILTSNQQTEDWAVTTYEQRENIRKAGGLIFNTRDGEGPSPDLYEAGVFYGYNLGNNPYPYPPRTFGPDGKMALSAGGNYPDLGLENARKVWGEQYKHLMDIGLDMIWQDMTCPAIDEHLNPDVQQNRTFAQDLMMAREETGPGGTKRTVFLPNAKLHNSYVLNLLRGTWDGINQLRPSTRNFIIARGGYAGMQRYAALWTGDSKSTWDFLRINIPEVLNLGLSGVPISGCDIGGFSGTGGSSVFNGTVVGGVTNAELLTRWMQLGSFLPWYRNHYDGYNKQFQEAYAYPEPTPTNCRRYVELRYRMLQVYYDAMYRWTQTGLPIARPLFLQDSADPTTFENCDNQFLVGDDFLVAPIVQPAVSGDFATRDVYLPKTSLWYAFEDNTRPIQGGVNDMIMNYGAGLDRVPIYVREGAILPFCELQQWVGEIEENPLTINCYPGPDRWTDSKAYQLYLDDGVTNDAEASGKFRLSRIYQRTITPGGRVSREVRIARVTDKFTPPAQFNYIGLLGSITAPISVVRDGTVLPNIGTNPTALLTSPVDAWYWNESLQTVFVKIFDNRADSTTTINY